MIAALYALAAAMVIGGSAAVIQGFPYVRLESGLALVIAGSVAASSGAVLFGLGAVAAGLRRVERAAGRGASAYAAPSPEASAAAPASEARPRLPPVLPPAPVPAVPAMVAPPYVPPVLPERSPHEPALREQAWREPEPAAAERAPAALHEPAVEPEPELPIPGLTPAPPAPVGDPEPVAPPPAEPGPATDPEDDLFAVPGDGGSPAALNLRRGLDAAPDPEPENETAAAPHGAVVGRYASGGNTYLMFENGSIEAETPQGRFTFASLDELKAFVDAGGESGTRGAA